MFSSLRLRGRKQTPGQELPRVTAKPPPPPRRNSKCGGAEKGLCPSIGSLRASSPAHRSDAVAPGERVAAVNGVRTSRLSPDRVASLLGAAPSRALLEIQYPLPDYSTQPMCVQPKVTQIQIEREEGSLGFTLRGGSQPDPSMTRPLVVTQVRKGGPAEREGSLQPGDRILAVDGASLQSVSLSDAYTLLNRNCGESCSTVLTIEYNVSAFVAVQQATGPLLVEIARTSVRDLGITLSDSNQGVIIDSIKPASTADRCGALHIGDQILAVDSIRLEGSVMRASEVLQLIYNSTGNHLTLEILPHHLANKNKSGFLTSKYQPPSPCQSMFNTINSRTYQQTRLHRQRSDLNANTFHDVTSCVNTTGWLGVSHTETLSLQLHADEEGYGLILQAHHTNILVAGVEPGSPADKCGCIQVGDRLIGLNNKSVLLESLSVSDVLRMLNENTRIMLQLEFDVADSVIPSSGVFSVKLPKRGNSLGITITASKCRLPDEPFVISDIRRGSVAHRTGTLQPGDRLLAINGMRLDQCSLEDTQHILQSSSDIVTLKIHKDDTLSDSPENKVIYTVELARHGGPLGITVAGSEEPFEPITISGLTNGGLAQQTGALHIGDRLLAINGESLIGKPLSEAIALLQDSGDTVTLKIAKDLTKVSDNGENGCQEDSSLPAGEFGPGIPSVDSAVESLNSSILGHTPPVTELYQAESATVKRKYKIGLGMETSLSHWDGGSQSSRSVESDQSGMPVDEKIAWIERVDNILETETVNHIQEENHRTDDRILSWADSKPSAANSFIYDSPPVSPLPLPQYLRCNGTISNNGKHSQGYYDSTSMDLPSGPQTSVHQVTLFKDPVYEDFGFSVSDGLYERGVYINKIRPGGPADLSNMLKPFDRILQVNDTRTHDFDCCLTVPLMASAGEKMELTVARHIYSNHFDSKESHSPNGLTWVEDEDGSKCSESLHDVTGTLTKIL